MDSKFEYEESRLVKHRLQVHRAPQLLLVITHIFGKTKKMSGPLKTLKSFKKGFATHDTNTWQHFTVSPATNELRNLPFSEVLEVFTIQNVCVGR